MTPAEKEKLATLVSECLAELYDKVASITLLDIWVGALDKYPLAAVEEAFRKHITDPESGRFAPKPADIVRHLAPQVVDDGHPHPDIAWGMLIQFATNEYETGVLTEQIRAGWSACAPILKLGDEVGARKCFLQAYEQAVAKAREKDEVPCWSVSLGHCPQTRERRLKEAVEAGRIAVDKARLLLPCIHSPHDQEAMINGLLEAPKPEEVKQIAQTSQRIRSLTEVYKEAKRLADIEREAERERRCQELEQKRLEDERKTDEIFAALKERWPEEFCDFDRLRLISNPFKAGYIPPVLNEDGMEDICATQERNKQLLTELDAIGVSIQEIVAIVSKDRSMADAIAEAIENGGISNILAAVTKVTDT